MIYKPFKKAYFEDLTRKDAMPVLTGLDCRQIQFFALETLIEAE